MSIALIVTRGFGNGTLVGSIKDVVTRGYGIASAITIITPPERNIDILFEARNMDLSFESSNMDIENDG